MFYKRTALWTRLHRKLLGHKALDTVLRFGSGLHTAHGLAHGVEPSRVSVSRRAGSRDCAH